MFSFHKGRRILLLSEPLSSSQVGLCSTYEKNIRVGVKCMLFRWLMNSVKLYFYRSADNVKLKPKSKQLFYLKLVVCTGAWHYLSQMGIKSSIQIRVIDVSYQRHVVYKIHAFCYCFCIPHGVSSITSTNNNQLDGTNINITSITHKEHHISYTFKHSQTKWLNNNSNRLWCSCYQRMSLH
jgi:hypothetical protein